MMMMITAHNGNNNHKAKHNTNNAFDIILFSPAAINLFRLLLVCASFAMQLLLRTPSPNEINALKFYNFSLVYGPFGYE